MHTDKAALDTALHLLRNNQPLTPEQCDTVSAYADRQRSALHARLTGQRTARRVPFCPSPGALRASNGRHG